MLFDKDTLVDNVHDSDWDWAVRDEIETKGVSKEQAEHNALEWFKLMDNHTLFYNRMSEWTRQALINAKADELRGK